jgi:hypothetical protein
VLGNSSLSLRFKEVRVWNKVINSETLKSHRQRQVPPDEPGLLVALNLNHPNGSQSFANIEWQPYSSQSLLICPLRTYANEREGDNQICFRDQFTDIHVIVLRFEFGFRIKVLAQHQDGRKEFVKTGKFSWSLLSPQNQAGLAALLKKTDNSTLVLLKEDIRGEFDFQVSLQPSPFSSTLTRQF